ncbi:2938_t:CDS:2 [Paraglomus occultum]|uniref:2938_t:CDS:1 n=1 Tax=Paraglomus occultum TaxID=144539 RepID=A0A9N9DPU4_9GLOM|nr:2938_t:CDS:2 [Paraglomus occultum]
MSSRTSKVAILILVIVLVLGPAAYALSAADIYVPTSTYSDYNQAACRDHIKIGTIKHQPSDHVPDAVKVPKGNKFKFLLYASGYQHYQCKVGTQGQPGNWTFVGPVAYLINDIRHDSFENVCDRVAFHHLEKIDHISGVAWSGIIRRDHSTVVAKAVKTYPSPDGENNIPWLLAKANYNWGVGAFSDVTYIYRTKTYGGRAPPNEKCGAEFPDGYEYASPYKAQYWYYRHDIHLD